MAYRHRGSCINEDMKVVNRQRWPISRGSQSKCNRRGSRSGVTWQHNRSTAGLNISLHADGGVTLCNRFYPYSISRIVHLCDYRDARVSVSERRFSRHILGATAKFHACSASLHCQFGKLSSNSVVLNLFEVREHFLIIWKICGTPKLMIQKTDEKHPA